MWENLKLKFASQNKQNILQLKSNLQNLRKGADDIETYLDKIKEARDALETVGVQVDDKDIVVTILRGLHAKFAAIKIVIRAQGNPRPSFNNGGNNFNNGARNFGNNNNFGPPGFNNNAGQGNTGFNNGGSITCQFCNRFE
ncbi:hypothetical protein ACLB2K_034424 [Fragaria x ananassa]